MKSIQRIALYLFFFSINFEVWDPLNTNGSFSISRLMGFVYLVSMIPTIVFSLNSTRNEVRPIFRTIWIFFGLLTVVNIFNINVGFHSFFNFSIFMNIILLWILITHESHDQHVLDRGMISFAIGSVALALLYNAGIGIEYSSEGRVSIFGDNENIIGLRMSISISILVMAFLQNPLELGKIRYVLLLPVPIMLQFLAESGSRVALLAFILSFISASVLLKTKNIRTKLLIFATGILIFYLIWHFMMQTDVIRIRLLRSMQEGDLSNRDVIWQQIIPIIKGNPIFGIGETGYHEHMYGIFGEITSPHNVILEVLCYTGIVGLIVYLIFLYRIFIKSIQLYRNKGMLLPLLLLIPVMGMLLSGHILVVKIGWVIFAYIIGRSFIEPDQIQEIT
jgi:O-antigen ligase